MVDTVWPGRGGTPLQPQAFYDQTYVLIPTISIPPNLFYYDVPDPPYYSLWQSWTWGINPNLFPPLPPPTPPKLFDWGVPDPPIKVEWQQPPNVTLLSVRPAPFRQSDWPNAPTPPRLDQTWTWTYNKNLVGQDLLPVGEQVYVLAPAQLPPDQIQLRAWSWSYNLNLIGRDRLPVGKEIYELAPGQVPPPAENIRHWEWKYNQNLIGKDQLPVGEIVYDLVPSQRPPEQIALHSWQWNYNLNLIGQDKFPIGENVTDLPPRAYDYHVQFRTWLQTLTPSQLLAPFHQTDWPLPIPPPRLDQTFTATYNKNLVGQDAMVTGDQRTELPPQPDYHIQLRSWAWSSTFYYIAVAKPFAQYDWQLTPAPRPIDQTIAASYNPNLVGQDKLPVGEIVSDLAPAQRPFEQTQLHGWQWTYNLNLIGKDRLPFRQQDWPNPQPVQWYQTWAIFQLGELELEVPFRQLDWPLPSRGVEPDARRSWTWGYNLDLIGKDQLPIGEITWELTPRDPREVRSWQWNYNLNLIGQDKLPVGEISFELTPRAYQQPAQSWTWNYNQNLIGQDKMLTGEQVTDLPPRDFARLFQTWIESVNLALTTAPPNIFAQARQQDWPNPRGTEPDWRRSWEWSYNRNLIGQDQLPFRQTDWPLTRAPVQPERTIAANYNDNLIGKDQLPFRQTDWPNPIPPALVKDWIQSVNLALTTAAPNIFAQARQQDWPNPTQPPRLDQTWTASYNQNLIGKDQLPNRQQDWPNPVTPAQFRDWIQSTNIALLAVQKPFSQTDWPLTPAAQQPDRTITASYLETLIGQDKLPAGVQRFDLWPAGPQQPDRSFGVRFNLNLRGQDQLPNRQQDWPLSPAHIITPLQVMVAGTPFFLTLAPLGLPLNATRIFDLAPVGPAPLLQQSIYEYNLAFIPTPAGPTLILRTLMGTGV